MKKYLLAFAALCSTPFSWGAISFDIQSDQLRKSDGSPAGSASSGANATLVLLVADTGNDGFGSLQSGQSTAVNSVFGDLNDRIVGRFDLSVNGVDGYFGANPGGLTYSSVTGWAQGEKLALIWMPGQSLATSTITSGSQYGFYSSQTPPDGSPWITPSGGSTGSTNNYQLYFFNAAGTIQSDPGVSASLGNASLVVSVGAAPEPSVSCLALLGAAGMVLRRRRSR